MGISEALWVQALAYIGAGLCIGFGAISVALGEGYAAGKAGEALGKNPSMNGPILKNMLIGQAVAESAGIFALVVSMMLIFLDTEGSKLLQGFAYLGAGLSMGLSATGSGLGSGFPAAECCQGIADNPPTQGNLATNMLIGSALCQTPSIFGMVVAFMLMFLDMEGLALWPHWAAYTGAGLCMGLAAIGSGLGSGIPAGTCVRGIARQPGAMAGLRTNMLVGSAVTQTPAIFGMVVAFLLLFMDWTDVPPWPAWAGLIGAALSTGMAAIGPGLGNGLTAGEACSSIARTPETQGPVTTTMLIGQTVAQSTTIYGFLVSLVLLFVPVAPSEALDAWVKLLAAGLCMGFGALGPGLGVGLAAAYTVTRIGRDASQSKLLTRVMLVSQAVAESTGIYALIIALLLLFVV